MADFWYFVTIINCIMIIKTHLIKVFANEICHKCLKVGCPNL